METLETPMPKPNPTADTYSEAETVARREAALSRMLATPHKKHEPIGKRKRVESKA